jgi:hypothetical protein
MAATRKKPARTPVKKPAKKPAKEPADGSIAIGTVFAVPLPPGRWTACQIVGAGADGLVVADLHVVGDAPPTLDALADVPILRVDHHAWEGEIQVRNVPPSSPPAGFRALGVAPPRAVRKCIAFGSWGNVGGAIELQARWDALPAAVRARYKATKSGTSREVTFDLGDGPRKERADTWRLDVVEGAAPVRFEALDALPHLTDLGFEGRGTGLIEALVARPLIHALSWSGHGRSEIDLSATRLLEVGVQATGPLRLVLPETVRELRLSGDASAVTVSVPGDGRAVSLMIAGDAHPTAKGLPELEGLSIVNADAIEAARLAAHPGLRRLELHGENVSVPDVERLADLRALEVLSIVGGYRVDAAKLPRARDAWPALAHVNIDGFRKADTDELRRAFEGVPSVTLRGGKTDAWLAANHSNPFRDWVERDAKTARAATAAFKKARTAIGDGADAKATKAALRAFVAVFDALDEKPGLDTVDVEEVAEVFLELAHAGGVEAKEAEAWFEGWRKF